MPQPLFEEQPRQRLAERIAHFPITLFFCSIGLTALALAWQKFAANIPLLVVAANLLTFVSTLFFILLAAIFTTKFLMYRSQIIQEFNDPLLMNVFPAISISLMLLSILWSQYPIISKILWFPSAGIQTMLTLYIVFQWWVRSDITLTSANPLWFIPVLGSMIAPITGDHLGYINAYWGLFSTGIFFCVLISLLILFRFLSANPLPTALKPTLFIFIAPPSISFIVYVDLTRKLDSVALVLYSIALFTFFILISRVCIFIKYKFSLSSWGYSFPLAALTIATFRRSLFAGSTFWWWLGCAFLCLTTLIVVALTLKTICMYRRNEICVSVPAIPTPYANGILSCFCRH